MRVPKYKKTIIYGYWEKYEATLWKTSGKRTYVAGCSLAMSRWARIFPDRDHPDDVTVLDIEDYRLHRIRQGATAKTVVRELAVLRAFWNWLIGIEWANHNPFSKRASDRIYDTREVDGLEPAVFEELLLACQTNKEKALLLLLGNTGLQPKQLLDLTWAQLEPTGIRRGEAFIPLRPDVLAFLQGLPRESETMLPMSKSNIQATLRRVGLRCGYERISPERIRAMFVVCLLRDGADPRTVRKALGLRNSSSLDRYLPPEASLAPHLGALPGAPRTAPERTALVPPLGPGPTEPYNRSGLAVATA